MTEYSHNPVLVQEVIEGLDIKSNTNVIDVTVGGGGHAKAILEASGPDGFLLGLDWDEAATNAAREHLAAFGPRVSIKSDSYVHLQDHVTELGDKPVNAILADLGLSSAQLDDKERGFSFLADNELSMRFDNQSGLTARDILAAYSEKELITIFREYGEEPLAYQIAKEICKRRKDDSITGEVLREICEEVYTKKFRTKSATHPATRVWQALRIVVNEEFKNIEKFVPQALEILESGGRLGIITFHSKEAALVKKLLRVYTHAPAPDLNSPLPEEFTPQAIAITKKAIRASEEEVKLNPRARSAQLRIIEKI